MDKQLRLDVGLTNDKAIKSLELLKKKFREAFSASNVDDQVESIADLEKGLQQLEKEYDRILKKQDKLALAGDDEGINKLDEKRKALKDTIDKRRSLLEQLKAEQKSVTEIDAKTHSKDEETEESQKKSLLGLKKIFKMGSKIALSVLGIRTAYALVQRGVSTILKDNEKLKNTLTALYTGVGVLFEPLVNNIISGMGKILSYAFAIVKQITGINLLAKTLSRMKKNAGGNKDGNLASFDKSEVLKQNNGGDVTDTYLEDVKLLGNLEAVIERIKGVLTPLFEFLKTVGLYIYENVLKPIGEWVMNSALPVFIDLVVAGISFIHSALQLIWPIIQYVYENFIAPVAGTVGEMFLSVIELIAYFIGKVAEQFAIWYQTMLDNPDILEAIGTVLGIIAGVLTVIIGLYAAWMALQLVSKLFNPISLALLAIGLAIGWVIDNWDQFGDTVTLVLNHALTAVEWFCNKFIDAWNSVKSAINSLSVDLPEFLGGGHIGFNLPMTNHVSLPRIGTPTKPGLKSTTIPKGAVPLAKGAVLQPNKPFLAMLGDQTSGRNLEAPEDLIRQIVREETGGNAVTINVSADGTSAEFVRWLKFELSKEDKRSGASLVI